MPFYPPVQPYAYYIHAAILRNIRPADGQIDKYLPDHVPCSIGPDHSSVQLQGFREWQCPLHYLHQTTSWQPPPGLPDNGYHNVPKFPEKPHFWNSRQSIVHVLTQGTHQNHLPKQDIPDSSYYKLSD